MLKKKNPFYKSFGHAFSGLFEAIKEERNMKIHLFIAALVLVAGVFFQISRGEWVICFLCFGLVFGLEMVNTAIEKVVDLVTDTYHPLAKQAKDMAAGAVLIAALMAAAAGLLIFVPRLWSFLTAIVLAGSLF